MGIIEKLKGIIGKEYKYGQMCRALDIPTKSGEAKIKQLNDLQNYCEIEVLSSPTRYVVKDVYEGAVEAIRDMDKMQYVFDSALFQALLNNHCQPLYMSDMELLLLFKEVNESFKQTFDKEAMEKKGVEYIYMVETSHIVYKMLRQWTKRRIQQMEKRMIILPRMGFRVYAKIGKYIVKRDVPFNSELEDWCKSVYRRAIEDTMPKDWKGEWVPLAVWQNFEFRLNELAQERNYFMVKKVTVISPPDEKWMVERLKQIYKQAPELKKINSEACRKVLNSKQLNFLTGEERQKYVDEVIKV